MSLKELVTTGRAGGIQNREPLKTVWSKDSLTTVRWSTVKINAIVQDVGLFSIGSIAHSIGVGPSYPTIFSLQTFQ
jgi:hypothetical protein